MNYVKPGIEFQGIGTRAQDSGKEFARVSIQNLDLELVRNWSLYNLKGRWFQDLKRLTNVTSVQNVSSHTVARSIYTFYTVRASRKFV